MSEKRDFLFISEETPKKLRKIVLLLISILLHYRIINHLICIFQYLLFQSITDLIVLLLEKERVMLQKINILIIMRKHHLES